MEFKSHVTRQLPLSTWAYYWECTIKTCIPFLSNLLEGFQHKRLTDPIAWSYLSIIYTSFTFDNSNTSTWGMLRYKQNQNEIRGEEASVYKMSYHLYRPHEPIWEHLRWPSQSWQGTLRGWGSLDWRWKTRSSLVPVPQCPLAGPQPEPEARTTRISQH